MSAKRATFSRFDECTEQDLQIIMDNMREYSAKLPNRVLDHLKLLEGDFGGFSVDRLEHSLQTATRAYRDGRDEEYVVCCLLHDIGDTLGCLDHGAIVAAIMKPFASEANLWMLENHTVFQGYYYFEHLGSDKHARDRFKDHPYYQYTKEFIEKYDMPSFDQDYDTMSLEAFEPMVHRVLTSNQTFNHS